VNTTPQLGTGLHLQPQNTKHYSKNRLGKSTLDQALQE